MLQLALDLFGWTPVPPIASAPVTPDAAVRYTHPRANRRALLADVLVEYELRRRRRRTIGFAVGCEGLTVSAPRWTPEAEIDAALREKARWIAKGLARARARAARLAAARIDWRLGAAVPYLGAPAVLAADPRAGRARLEPSDRRGRSIESAVPSSFVRAELVEKAGAQGACPDAGPPQILCLPLPPQATPAQWRAATAAWLMRQARRLFTERLDHYAPQLGVRWQRLSLSSAQTRWGSAGSAGSIRLNWRLIHLSLPVIDYVVVHELAHLREMNHGPRFWACVAAVLPDYATRRAALRDAALPGF